MIWKVGKVSDVKHWSARMADPEDLKLLEFGETDLQRSDFSGADLSSKKFSKIDFTGCNLKSTNFKNSMFHDCKFQQSDSTGMIIEHAKFMNCSFSGVLFGVKAKGALFQRSSIKCLITRTDLADVKFEMCDVKGMRFNEKIELRGATTDTHTDFTGVKMERSLSRNPIFSDYEFKRGELVRVSKYEAMVDETTYQSADSSFDVETNEPIKLALETNPETIRILCLSLSLTIKEAIELTPKPNDPEKLDQFESYQETLLKISDHAQWISASLEGGTGVEKEATENAVENVVSLKTTIDHWWNNNAPALVDSGMRIGLIGAGVALLALCGAPAAGATAIASCLVGGDKVVDALKGFK